MSSIVSWREPLILALPRSSPIPCGCCLVGGLLACLLVATHAALLSIIFTISFIRAHGPQRAHSRVDGGKRGAAPQETAEKEKQSEKINNINDASQLFANRPLFN